MKNILKSASCISFIFLFGHVNCAQSAVFDELDNGVRVLSNGGVSSDTPPLQEADYHKKHFVEDVELLPPAGLAGETKEVIYPARPAGAVVLDMPTARRVTQRGPNSTRHRQLTHQKKLMRQLAIEIARSFADRPAVARANLDEEQFIALFTTMIQQESGFDPLAVSSAGASGLGQLMPATARELGVGDVFSAPDNLRGAANYLTSMLDQFGTPELALAAYNAGPGAVRKYGGVPPYRETREYVAEILRAVERASDNHLGIDRMTTGSNGQQANSDNLPAALSVLEFFGMN